MATYTYKGTKITGTSTSAKVFRKSGISNAKPNQKYLNTKYGHVYICRKGGNAKTATWAYTGTQVIKKPTTNVKNLGTPTRGSGRTMRAAWQVPSELVDAKRGDRATKLRVSWSLGIDGTDPKRIVVDENEKATSASCDLDNFRVGSKTYTRNSFYPLPYSKPSSKLTYVTVGVAPGNDKGFNAGVSVTRYFTSPRKPTIDAFGFDSDTGTVSTVVRTDAGADYQERYDTRYKMTVENTFTGSKFTAFDSKDTRTAIPLSYDATGYQRLPYGAYIKVTVEAWARGYAGDSAHETRSFYVAYPAQVTIDGVDVTGMTSGDKCIANIRTNNSTAHPVDGVRLEYLASTPYADASEIPPTAQWTTAQVVDDGDCTGMSVPIDDIWPDDGTYSYIRIKSYHANEDVLFRYSNFWRVRQLETPAPTAQEDTIAILETSPGGDGKSIDVLLGWNASGSDGSTGTELSWSGYEDTWKSTDEPDEFTFTWSDGPLEYGGTSYGDSAQIVIKGLDESTKYYIRARRYLELESGTVYSDYSDTKTDITSERPSAVMAQSAGFVPVGSSLPVYWTFSGNGIQTDWQLVSEAGEIVLQGNGSQGACQIPYNRVASCAVDGTLTFYVEVSTGSQFVRSGACIVQIVEQPEITLTAPEQLTAQPFEFEVSASSACDLVVIVSAQGATGQYPDGVRTQAQGDTVHSAVYQPPWTSTQDGYAATITLPTGLDFWDLARYDLSVVGIDRTSGLSSTEQVASFAVAWAHQAPDCSEAVTIEPQDYTDDDGNHVQQAVITLTPPEGSAETDLYDLYRYTADGAVLIGQSFPLTCVTTDAYMPFGSVIEHYYRVAVRTADGDVSFADVSYDADGSTLRFDWSDGSLELPYNLSISDGYSKDVEIQTRLDGAHVAHWNSGVKRKASFSSDLIRLDDQDSVARARALARHTGAVFVRTPDGSAYEADVQVSDLSTTGTMEAIAIDATEIALTREFALPTPYTQEQS